MDMFMHIYTIGERQWKCWVQQYPHPNDFGQFMWNVLSLQTGEGVGGLVASLDDAELAIEEYVRSLENDGEVQNGI